MPHATLVATRDRGERHARALEQAELLTLGRYLDIDDRADAVRDVARRERHELMSRLALAFQNLRNRDQQPERRGASRWWAICEPRLQGDELLGAAPSPRTQVPTLPDVARRQGWVAALNETGLSDDAVPEAGTTSLDEVLTRTVAWPES